ncbi:Fes1 domain-containing protein [Chloropicon primus]|nr:Fes1 domain-containing protein [Chloropicon primus]
MMNNGGGGGGGGPDWNGLLKWSLKHNDGTSKPRTFTEEERRWFYEAMESQVEDEGERLKQDMLVLAQSGEGEVQGVSVERQVDILEDVEDLVSQIDLAKTFVKMEGLVILLRIARDRGKDDRLRAGALTAASTCLQHNPEGQEDFLRRGGVEAATEIVAGGKAVGAKVRAKAVGVISAAVKHHRMGFLQFLQTGGVGVVAQAVALGEEEGEVVLLRKGLRLLEYVARQGQGAEDLGRVPVKRLLGSGDLEVREACLGLLAVLGKGEGEWRGEVERIVREGEEELRGGEEERRDEVELAKEVLGRMG